MATFSDVCQKVKDHHPAQYLTTPEAAALAGVAKNFVRGVQLKICVDPYFGKPVEKAPCAVAMWQARNLVRAGAVLEKITFRLDPPHHWVGRKTDWYMNFHFMLRDFTQHATSLHVGKNVNMGKILWIGSDWLPKLSSFSIVDDRQLTDVASLSMHTKMTSLSLQGCRQLSNVAPLGFCTALRDLNLSQLVKLKSIEPLASCQDLEVLNLSDCREIESLKPLEGLCKLRQLDMSFACEHLTDKDFGPLSSLVSLEKLDLRKTAIADVKILAACSKLLEVNLQGCKKVEEK